MFTSKKTPATGVNHSYDPRNGKKIVFFGGKGGVGKTTCSSAFAISCAKAGDKTLLVSTDPAHSLADVFGVSIGAKIVPLAENLYALEIDAELESRLYTDRIKSQLPHGISPVIVDEIHRQIDAAVLSPGSEEAAIFDKFIEIVEERAEEYDRIVFDTAPTGHTLRLLSLPELLGGWMDSMIKKRKQALNLMKMISAENKARQKEIEEDKTLALLNARKLKMEKARDILIDSGSMEFVFVLNPEKLPIVETKRAMDILNKNHVPVAGVVVNRTIPEEFCRGNEFWSKRKALELQYMDMIHAEFKDKILTVLPLLEGDVRGDTLDSVAEHFSAVRDRILGKR